MSTTEDKLDDNRKPAATCKKNINSTTNKKLSKKQQDRLEAIEKHKAILAALENNYDSGDDEDEDDNNVDEGDDVNNEGENECEKIDVGENEDEGIDKVEGERQGEGEGEDEEISEELEKENDNGKGVCKKNYDNNNVSIDYSKEMRNNNSTVIPETHRKYGNNEYILIQHHDRLEIKLPWLESGYDFNQLDPQQHDITKKKKKLNLRTIPYDMFPEDNAITNDYGYNYFKHIHKHENKYLEPTEIEITNTVELLSTFRDKYKAYIMEIIYKFWFDIAKKIGICSYTGQDIRDNKSLVNSLLIINNEHDLHKIVLLLHIIFDWIPNYQKLIMDLLEIKFPIKILSVPTITKKRSGYHCMHLLITKVMTQERKTINKNLFLAIGIKVYVTREKQKGKIDSSGNKINVNHPERVQRCIYPYMIRGNFVSKNLYLFSK